MSHPLLLRLLALALTGLACAQWSAGSATFVWGTYSIGFAHYLLALAYSGRPAGAMLAAPLAGLSIFALLASSTGLYLVGFPLVAYFGLHHAMNEAYARSDAGTARRPGLQRAALVLQLLAYGVTLRFEPGFRWAGSFAAGAALLAACGWYARELMRTDRSFSLRRILRAAAPEIASLALVVVSLEFRISFLQVVLYHFVAWALLPLPRLRARGGNALGRYAAGSVALVAGAWALSPLGIQSARLPVLAFSELFLFWSYLHITLSLALSDTHPTWVVRLFRPAAPAALAQANLRR